MGNPDDDLSVEQVEPQAIALVHAGGIRQLMQEEILGGQRRDEAVCVVEIQRQASERIGEEVTGAAPLVETLHGRPIAEGPEDKLDIVGLATVKPVVSRLP